MDIIDDEITFQRDGIMYDNKRFWNLWEDGCGITRYILEVERVSKVEELIKSKSGMSGGVYRFMDNRKVYNYRLFL